MEFKTRKKWINDNLTYLDPLFKEQRRNILLDKGYHYHNPKGALKRYIDHPNFPDKARIRITKNHLNYIGRRWRNYLLDKAPGAGIFPQDDLEMKDQKTAELNRKVWMGAVNRHQLRSRFNDYTYQFIVPGELAVFVNWNYQKGIYQGSEIEVGPDDQPIGEPVNIWSGDFEFHVIDGWNLVTEQNARRFEETDCAFRMFIDSDKLKRMYQNDPAKLEMIGKCSNDVYNTFDSATGRMDRDTSGKVEVWYYFTRPSDLYPEGHFWIQTALGDLEEGDLPGTGTGRGIVWPIVYENYESSGDTCRGNSGFRHLISSQMNINRLKSKGLENSIAMSGDKFITQKGSKVRRSQTDPTAGADIFEYTGLKPDFEQGTAGEQFLAQISAELSEMYQLAGLDDQEIDKMPVDATATLFRSVSQKAKFDLAIKKFEDFVVRFCATVLEMARIYYSDEMLAGDIGSNEIVNIPEFRTADPLRYRIIVLPQDDDANTIMGKSLQTTTFLQYAAPYLDKNVIGILGQTLPYLNKEPAFREINLNYRLVTNMILALDRGEWVEIYESDPNDYIIPRLRARTLEADFKILHPFFKQMYMQQISQREALEKQKLDFMRMAEVGAIPTSGDVVRVNLYTKGTDGQPHRVWLPSETIKWVMQKLEQQGIAQQILASMDSNTVMNIGKAQALSGTIMGE
jgi:hypothetical protein